MDTLSISVPEILVAHGFISPADQEKIHAFSERSGMSYLKIALNFGYVSRKNYERALGNAGYHFAEIRQEAFDQKILDQVDLKFANDQLGLPSASKTTRWLPSWPTPAMNFSLIL